MTTVGLCGTRLGRGTRRGGTNGGGPGGRATDCWCVCVCVCLVWMSGGGLAVRPMVRSLVGGRIKVARTVI
jgi:hypothetical protein